MTPEMAMNEAKAIGMEEDQSMSDLFKASAPTGRFSAGALNSLVGAFNEVLVTMGIPEPYPEFTSGTRALPGEFVKGLAMVADATTSVGMKSPVDLEDVKDDTDLEMLAGKLMNLASDEEFAEKMTAMPDEGEDLVLEEGPTPVDTPPPPAAASGDEDALFMQRM
jgi:hypothetical protein